ncbi:flagellin-like hook-associated protein FlgL [Methylobacterium sp. OAE515]
MLTVAFNEKTGTDQSKLAVSGRKLTADSLGVSKAVNGTAADGEFDIQTDKGLASMQDTLKTALASLKSLQSGLGSNLSSVQTRQDFTKTVNTILDTGAANLVNADMNEEAANSQALSTRQSLGVSALSLANTAQQGILQLLR